VQVKKLFFESADFNFLNCDVFAFEIDDDGNAEITFFDENQFDLDLKCESYEIIPMRVIKDDQLFSKDITIEDFFTIE
jgi:hypothetical protein